MKKHNSEDNIKMVLYRDYDISLEKTNILIITIRKNGNTWRNILFDNIDKNYKCLLKIFDNVPGYNIVFFDNFGNIGINVSYVVDDITFFENEFICEKINDNDISKEEIKQLKTIINDNNTKIEKLQNEIEQLKILINNNIKNNNEIVTLPGIDENVIINTNTEILDFVENNITLCQIDFTCSQYINNMNKLTNVKKIKLHAKNYLTYQINSVTVNQPKKIIFHNANNTFFNIFQNGKQIYLPNIEIMELDYTDSFNNGYLQRPFTENIEILNKSFPNIHTLIITEFENTIIQKLNVSNLTIKYRGIEIYVQPIQTSSHSYVTSGATEIDIHIAFIIPITHFPNLHTLIFKNKFHDLRNLIPRELYQYYQSKNINVLFST